MYYIFYIVLHKEIRALYITLWQQSKKIEVGSLGLWRVAEMLAGTQHLESDMA